MMQCSNSAAKAPSGARIGRAQRSNNETKGIDADPDRNTPQRDPGNHDPEVRQTRQALGLVHGQIDHQADNRDRLEWQMPDAEPTDFDQPGQSRSWADEKAAMHGLDLGTVVGNKSRE